MVRLLCLCIWICFTSVLAQKNKDTISVNKTPLVEVIPLLESRFNVAFSYVDAILQDVSVSVEVDDTSSLHEIIATLQTQTKLKFTRTGTNYIAIRNFNMKDTLPVCGYVVNENNEPLKDINIFFKAVRSNVDTDHNGYFSATEIPFDSPILLSAPGFRQRIVNSSVFLQDDCYTIYLAKLIEELEAVTIQNYIAKGITKNKGIIAVNLKDVEILPGLTEPDILRSIQFTPGVNSPFETASGIYVRGGTPQQNLVLWNGIKTYHQGHFFGLLSAFNPYVVQKVDFYKSGVSAQYGDRVGGVIDIKTPDKVADSLYGGAGINMIHADAVIHTPLIRDKASVQISGRRSFTDIIQTPTYQKMAERVFQNTKIAESTELTQAKNDFFYEDYNANLILQPTLDDKIEFNGLYSKNELDYSGFNDQNTYNDQLRTENEGYNTRWTHAYANAFSHHIQGYYSKYLLNYQFITNSSGVFEENESKKNSVADYGGSIQVNYDISNSHRIIGGYQYTNNSIRYAFVTTTPSYELILDQDNSSLTTHAIYGEYEHEVPKNLYVKAGLRMNRYMELDQTFVEPRFSVQKYLSPYWNFSITGEYRTQSVSKIRESVVSDLTLENQVWTLSNRAQFPIITSYQTSLGSTFKKNKWLFDLDTYYKQIDNITSLTSGFINPVDNTYHLGESRVYGLDIFVKKRFRDYKTWISYSYINAQNKFDDLNDNKAFPGNWNIEHTVTWSHFYSLGNLKFSVGWTLHTGKSFTNIDGIDDSGELIILQFGELNANNLPLYHRLDFSTIYDIVPKRNSNLKYRIGLSILNLYDRKNLLNKEFRTTNTLNNDFLTTDVYGLGITPNLSFRVLW